MTTVYLSLGTNMGNRQAYVQEALTALNKLPQTQLDKVSAIYETAAWGNTHQADFLNLVCQLETDLSAHDFLNACQQIERDLGRVRHEHWGPRTIDIDILLYGEEIIKSDDLTVPHPYMTQRAFVLIPLADLNSTLTIPNTDQSVPDFLEKLDKSDVRWFMSSDALWKK